MVFLIQLSRKFKDAQYSAIFQAAAQRGMDARNGIFRYSRNVFESDSED